MQIGGTRWMDTVMEDLSSKWDEIKESIRIEYEIPDISYKTWIDPLSSEISRTILYILKLQKNWLNPSLL